MALLIGFLLVASDTSIRGQSGGAVDRAAGTSPVSVLQRAGSESAPPVEEFAAGSCRSFAPTGPDQHHTVFIDPGHGSPDPGGSGPVANGVVREASATLSVSLELLDLLRSDGFRVVLARTQDSTVTPLAAADLSHGAMTLEANHRDLLARVLCANTTQADLLLSIHFNAFEDPSVGGVETFYDAARPFAEQSRRFASLVQEHLRSALAANGWQVPDRGIATDASDDAPTLSAESAAYPYLLELGPADPGWLDKPSAMPGALSEPLFLSDPFEAAIAASAEGQRTLARGFAEAIEAYFAGPAATATPVR